MRTTISRKEFASSLIDQLRMGFDVSRISRWALTMYLDRSLEGDNELKEAIMDLITMDQGREFEFTEEELYGLARRLQVE